ncbi:hypothetical protein [Pedobacter alpinus]|uniref:hypothetical protein n=1 Tax=Pedobacter alpinus TaxID=1590643 RepID=UPI0036719EEC
MAQAKYEQLLNKTFAQRIFQLKAIIDGDVVDVPDSAVAFANIAKFKKFALAHKDEELILEADLLVGYYVVWHRGENTALVVKTLKTIIEKANGEDNIVIEARARALLANYYFRDKNYYELGFEVYFELEKFLEKVPAAQLPDKLVITYLIGECYYYFGEYEKALAYSKKAVALKPALINNGTYNNARNTIGLCYQLMGKLDSSDYYLKKLLNKNDPSYNADWEAIAKGNLGYNCYLRGDYKQAVPLLEADVKAAVARYDWGLASGSLIPLADIYLKLGLRDKAEKLVFQAKSYAELSKQYHRYATLYPVMSKMYAAKGELSLSNLYVDSAIYVKDSLARKFSAMQLFRAQQKLALQKHHLELDKVVSDKRMKTFERNLLLMILVSLIILAIYVYYNQTKRHQQQALIANLELENKERKLKDLKQQLYAFANNIIEKKQQIELLEKEFGKMSDNTILEKLRQHTIITDEGWERFRIIFSQVHVGYFQRLKDKIPDLTPAETRFMALNKLQLSNKEMAAVLGISIQSVRNIRSRLLKKLNLLDQESFEGFADEI